MYLYCLYTHACILLKVCSATSRFKYQTILTWGPFKKYVTQGGWVVAVIFVTMRYEKYGGWGSNVVRYVTQMKKLKTH